MNKEAIDSIEKAIKIGCEQPQLWFRGHPQCYGTLVPKVFRHDFLSKLRVSDGSEDRPLHEWDPPTDWGGYPNSRPDWGGLKRHEAELIEDFMRHAPARANDLPASEDKLSWLVLMQHHGLATRLLDWSESVLVALFFAVTKDEDEDGELWVWDPHLHYGDELGFDGLPWTEDVAKRPIVTNAWSPKQEPDLGFVEPIFPPMRFPRMLAQSSVFTVHSPPDDPSDEQGEIYPDGYRWAIHAPDRYDIPSDAKSRLRRDLLCLGISTRFLFPDLDHLSASLLEDPYRPVRQSYVVLPKTDSSV